MSLTTRTLYCLFLPDKASPKKSSEHREDDAYARRIAGEINYCDYEECDCVDRVVASFVKLLA